MARLVVMPVLASVLLNACAGPPTVPAGGMLGYGTPGVSSHLRDGAGETVQALLERCRTVPAATSASAPQTLEAACDQLRRTSRNQPGNALGG